MLDTVGLRSVEIEESEARQIESCCVRRSGVQISTGQVRYELTTGQLEGSYDTKVALRVKRERYENIYGIRPTRTPAEKKEHGDLMEFVERVVARLSEPYLEVEGSVHKALLGHNVYGGPEDFGPAVAWFLDDLSHRIGCELPEASSWLPRRIDWAEVYELPFEAIQLYIRGLNSADYPWRGQVSRHQSGISSYGHRSGVKAYNKGMEFADHDSKRLKYFLDCDELEGIQQTANERLRWEVEMKAKKLCKDHEKLQRDPRVDDITVEYLRYEHDREVRRLVREGEADMQTVRKYNEVKTRLHEVYPRRRASMLLSTWMQFAGVGEKSTREDMTKTTFYRHRQELKDAGVSWHAADVHIDPRLSSLPSDFRPLRGDPRHVSGEDPRVAEQLAPYRAA